MRKKSNYFVYFLFYLITTAKSQTTINTISFCTNIGPCEPGKCCKTLASGLFGNIGKCEELPVEGEACDINCPCADGFSCTVNPLCIKCKPICMKNSVVKRLNFYLNNACFGNCTEGLYNHLFKPAASGRCKMFKKEGEFCNEFCKCMNGTYCSRNVLCKKCDDICIHGEVVDSLITYFNKGCLKNCDGTISKYSKIFISSFDTNKIKFDSRGTVIFPEIN